MISYFITVSNRQRTIAYNALYTCTARALCRITVTVNNAITIKRKCFPYSLPSVWLGADPGVQAVSPQVTIGHPPGGKLPLLSTRPAVTFPAAQHNRPLAGTKLYCLVTEAHRCEQPAQGCYAAFARVEFEPTAC